MRNLLILIFLMGFSFASNAQVVCNGTTQCTGPARDLITRIFPAPTTTDIRITAIDVVTQLGCDGVNLSGANDTILLKKPEFDDNGAHTAGNITFEETFAVLLTAVAANENITLRIDTAQTVCTISYISWNP